MTYSEHIKRGVFSVKLLEQRSGYICFETSDERFLRECGGHRFQRIPPTERNGRVHTSTVTVACLSHQIATSKTSTFVPSKLIVEYYRSGGPGGQNKNKVETACRLKYDNIIVTCSDERSKKQNYKRALKDLQQRLYDTQRQQQHAAENNDRQIQIGSGQRGDKIRTYRERDDIVIYHNKNMKYRMSDVMNGKILQYN
jgi:peptide chain release factor 1